MFKLKKEERKMTKIMIFSRFQRVVNCCHPVKMVKYIKSYTSQGKGINCDQYIGESFQD